VLQDGPGSDNNNLFDAGVTDDGDRLWYVGTSGAIGEFDVQSGSQVTDHSAPNDVTNNFNAVAVTGPAGDANVYIGGDAGEIYYTFDNGNSWSETTPGSGAGINAVDFHGPRSGHAIDGNQTVLETTDGTNYQSVGIDSADGNFFGLDSNSADDVWVVTDNGRVYHNDGSEWTSESISDMSLYDIDIEGGSGVAVGDDGNAFDLVDGSWSQTTTSDSQTLAASALGAPNVAVGADGTILERPQKDDDSIGDGDDGSGDDGSGDDGSGDDGSGDDGSGDDGSGDDGSGDDGNDDGSDDDGSNGGDSELLSPSLGRFDIDDSGHITFDEVINAIDAYNSDRPVGGEPVTSQDVIGLIAYYNRN